MKKKINKEKEGKRKKMTTMISVILEVEVEVDQEDMGKVILMMI